MSSGLSWTNDPMTRVQQGRGAERETQCSAQLASSRTPAAVSGAPVTSCLRKRGSMRMLRPCWCFCACIAVSVAASAEPDSVPHADTAQPDVNLDTTLVEPPRASSTPVPSGNATSIPPHPPEGDAERDPASALSTVSSPFSTPTAAPTETVDVSSYGVESPIASSKSFETSAATADVDSSSSSSAPPPSASPEPSPAPTPPVVLVDVPAPAPPVIEELPLTEAPPAPEFLSFNEWRERYVVQPDSSAARRAKKRPRQDAAAPGSLRRRRRGGARRRAGRRRDSKRAARGRRDGGQGRRSPRRCRLGNTGPGCLRGRRPRPRTDGVLVPFADPAPPQRRHGRAIGPSRPPQGPRKLCRRRVRRQAAPLVAPVQGRLVNPDREEGPLHADAVRGDAQVRRR